MTTPRAIEPMRLTLIDGQERKFLLSMGGIRRLKERFGVKVLGEILKHDVEACGVPILWESLLDKTGFANEGEFAEQLPAHLDSVASAVLKLMGASLPDEKANPTDGAGAKVLPMTPKPN